MAHTPNLTRETKHHPQGKRPEAKATQYVLPLGNAELSKAGEVEPSSPAVRIGVVGEGDAEPAVLGSEPGATAAAPTDEEGADDVFVCCCC